MNRPVRLGMVRLTDAAPLVYAKTEGLFAREGVDVAVEVEPSWANIADKLSWGMLDGAIMLPPLAIAMALGLRGPATPLLIPAGISLNGNSVTLGHRLAGQVLRDGRGPPAAMAARLRRCAGKLRLAVVHAFSTHDLFLRLFLEQGGIDPADIAFSVVAPSVMPDALAEDRIDGFCAGAPWGAVAAEEGVGRTVAISSELWANHPEKCLAVRAPWAEAYPSELAAVLRALDAAGRACDAPEATPRIALLLAAPEWLGVQAPLISASLPGGTGWEVDRSVFAAHEATVPNPAHGAWFVEQMLRWRDLPENAEGVVRRMYRPDLRAQALLHVQAEQS